MNAQQLIEKIREAGAKDNKAIIDVLCDGEALTALGVTDDDQEAVVEEAYNSLKAKSYNITIGSDVPEHQEFAAWLNAKGHNATLGNSTGSYVDGSWTSSSAETNEVFNSLWNQYCKSV